MPFGFREAVKREIELAKASLGVHNISDEEAQQMLATLDIALGASSSSVDGDIEESNARKVNVGVQFAVEMAFAKAMRDGRLKGAICVIHTPKVSTPVRDYRPDTDIESINKSSVARRVKSIRDMRDSGVMVITAYNDDANTGNLDSWQSEFLKGQKFEGAAEHIGATYKAETKGGEIITFSLFGSQIGQEAEKWELEARQQSKKTELPVQFSEVSVWLKEGVNSDIDELLAENIRNNERTGCLTEVFSCIRSAIFGCSNQER